MNFGRRQVVFHTIREKLLFREKTGGFPYYKGKITQKYDLYLNNLIKKPVSKKAPPKKPKVKKSTVRRPIAKNPVDKKKSKKKN